jgi:hypothetical protein
MIIVRGNFCLVSILKLPLISITLASLLPLITTVAPISGSALDSSETLPLITLCALLAKFEIIIRKTVNSKCLI